MVGRRRSTAVAGPDFDPESLGHATLRAVGNLCFAALVVGVVVFTVIAANYDPDDPLLRSSSRMTTFLTSSSNATFHPEGSVLRTGEDFIKAAPATADAASSEPFLTISEVVARGKAAESGAVKGAIATAGRAAEAAECDPAKPIECRMPEVYHLMMRAAMETFKDIHFYKFGKPTQGGNDTSCDMAWRFQPKDPKRASFYKDYRRFVVRRTADCSHAVLSIGEYHSGVNARKRKKGLGKDNRESSTEESEDGTARPAVVPLVGEDSTVDDSLPVVQSDDAFAKGRYLVYTGGGERCKPMDHYLWSLLCALGEARYLKRTLVLDLSICLAPAYTRHEGQQGEEGKDFRFYFDLQHLRESASVLEHRQFWSYWGRLHRRRRMGLHLVEDFRVTPMRLAGVKDALVMRKFGTVEPDNYWYRVCEGEAEPAIPRPWELLWKSRRLMGIVSAMASRLQWDFDTVHLVRGEKARNPALWPNLDADTSPDALLASLKRKGVEEGRTLYIATNEAEPGFFDPLRDKYRVHLLDDFKDLWAENSEWYTETKKLNSGVGVEFDGYMREEVDTEVFLRGKKQLETFNDLTSDCKDGINACRRHREARR